MVREPEIHREVICKVIDYADSIGFGVDALTYSPIKGPEGNIEYLVLLTLKRAADPRVMRGRSRRRSISFHS